MIKYVSIEDYTENDVLPGALSTESTFSVLNRGKNYLDIVNLKDHVSNEYAEDIMNKLFVSHDGVVANAFDLKFFDEEETNNIVGQILMDYKLKYPDYEFEIKKGKFPVKMHFGPEYRPGQRLADTICNSTHVLYIKNYGQFVKKRKLLIKK